MKIAISGATGLVGSKLKDHFSKGGHEVITISRHRGKNRIVYDLTAEKMDYQALEGVDVIIHLAGANISGERWSPAYKKEILDSRVKSTLLLVNAIKKLNHRPKIFLCASAVGYYGNHDPLMMQTEHSPGGHGFLADVCREWENASADLLLLGVRSIHMRFGVILSKKGGALAKMLTPFYFGLGGRLGNGKQKMSWIALDEIPSIIDFIIANDKVNGAVNFVSPYPVTNLEFTKTLGAQIHRPTIFPMPAFVVKLLFGQMGKELLLEGAHVVPQTLLNTGYHFRYPELKDALKQCRI